jgi:hypothetical protein
MGEIWSELADTGASSSIILEACTVAVFIKTNDSNITITKIKLGL